MIEASVPLKVMTTFIGNPESLAKIALAAYGIAHACTTFISHFSQTVAKELATLSVR